jgi:hypothetical protein
MSIVQRSGFIWLFYFIGWLLLAAVGAYVAWQAHVITLYLATWLISHPTWRPTGWNSGTLVALSKFSIFGWGTLWLIATYYMEYQLRTSLQERRLWQQWLRFAVIITIGLGIVSMPIVF